MQEQKSISLYFDNLPNPIIVDEEDKELIKSRNWYFSDNRKIMTTGREKGNSRHIGRIILQAKKGEIVDHINGNVFDNRRSNLRICLSKHNSQNRRKSLFKMTSKYKGVNWHKNNLKWEAGIKIGYKRYHLGSFSSEVRAAKAYDDKAKEVFGTYVNPNFNSEEEYQKALSEEK